MVYWAVPSDFVSWLLHSNIVFVVFVIVGLSTLKYDHSNIGWQRQIHTSGSVAAAVHRVVVAVVIVCIRYHGSLSDGSIGALTEPEFVTLVSWCDRLVVAANCAWPAIAVRRLFKIPVPGYTKFIFLLKNKISIFQIH